MIDISHVPAHSRAGLIAMTSQAIADLTIDNILETFEAGVSIPLQARALGVTHQALYRRLLTQAPQKWKEYQASHALAMMDNAEEMLMAAPDGVAVGRAREYARLQCWKLERAASAHYGQHPAPVQVTVNLSDTLSRMHQLEAELGFRDAQQQAQQPLTVDQSGEIVSP